MKNGKLFGKINIIDLLIIILIIVAIVFVAYRFFASRGEVIYVASETQKVKLTLYGEKVYDYIPDTIKTDDPASEFEKNVKMGKVISVSSEPAYEIEIDAQGNSVNVPIKNCVAATVTLETEAVIEDNKIKIEGSDYAVGGHYYVNIGVTRAQYQIKSVEVIDEK